jgi:hypothetical protein
LKYSGISSLNPSVNYKNDFEKDTVFDYQGNYYKETVELISGIKDRLNLT